MGSISYDLANAAGTVTNLPVWILDQFYDTNTFEFTTNTFQAFDVPLTNGLNTFTLHATDLAGNTMTTNINFALDYSSKTNPPIVQFIWPQSGMKVCGSNFICNGWVNDPTVTVAVQMVDTNGNTNIFNGVIGRDGKFWCENLPLNTGTNLFILIVTDVLGNATVTNLAVIQGDVGLVIDPIPNNQTTVTGKIDSSDYAVWVNGVKATLNGNGTWEADNVPIPPNSSQVQATAIPNTDNGGNGSGGGARVNPYSAQSQNAAATADNSGVFVSLYHNSYHHEVEAGWTFINDNAIDWLDGADGKARGEWVNDFWGPYDEIVTFNWPASSWPQAIPPGTGVDIVNGETNWQGSCPPLDAIFLEHCNADFAMTYPEYPVDWNETYHKDAQTKLALATGGQPGSTNVNLWMVSATATAEDFIPSGELPDDPPVDCPIGAIPFKQISVGIFGQLDDNGNAFQLLPDNIKVDVTPYVAGNDHYTFTDPPKPVTLNSVTVVSNAAQVGGINNWAAVKTNDYVYVQARLSDMSDPKAADQIHWSMGEKVSYDPFQVRISKATSDKIPVTATLGSTSKTLNLWVIWANVTVKLSGTFDPDDKTLELSGNDWPQDFGGGNGLGPIDCLSNTNLTYGFTIGKTEAKATLQPAGVGSVITSGWVLNRQANQIAWDNGGNYNSGSWAPGPSASSPPGTDDTSIPEWEYLNPNISP